MDDFFSHFWDILLWSLWFFFIIAWLMLLFRIFADLFSDKEASGFAKVAWSLFLIFFPLLGVLSYLIVRGKGMGSRELAKVASVHAAQQEYIRGVAGSAKSPAEQIASAKELLDSGAITQAEFDALKAKALS
ncbi:MAG: SHOCT domain-containing protein [Candidatus Nanopelagicales bacterium]